MPNRNAPFELLARMIAAGRMPSENIEDRRGLRGDSKLAGSFRDKHQVMFSNTDDATFAPVEATEYEIPELLPYRHPENEARRQALLDRFADAFSPPNPRRRPRGPL